MYEEPENNESETPAERASDPAARAKDRSDEFRMHAELVAVFEGVRKFDAEIKPKLDQEIAREVQRAVARLEKAKMPDVPVIKPESADEALAILKLPQTRDLSTNDYHIHRRPGEVMIVRWLAGPEQVETFYTRLQAHFDAALSHFRAEERQANEWRQEPATLQYLDALDALEVKMAERYLRPIIKQHNVFVLSTQTADEMDILHLADVVMSVDAAQIVGRQSAPPEEGATEKDRAWFFKLFSLRGMDGEVERMCFFTYLQKSDDDEW
jgi:hypothetical protein